MKIDKILGWNKGSVTYFFNDNLQQTLTKKQAVEKINEIRKDEDFQATTGCTTKGLNFLKVIYVGDN